VAYESKLYFYGRYESYTGGKMEREEPEIAVVGTKGQIVIPQRLRRELKITPKTKLVVYRKGDKLVVTRLEVPLLGEELKDLFREIDEQYAGEKRPTEKEILEEIQAYRREKRAKQGV
jgi:AbrB family looped-hinge helix DNA binding protein